MINNSNLNILALTTLTLSSTEISHSIFSHCEQTGPPPFLLLPSLCLYYRGNRNIMFLLENRSFTSNLDSEKSNNSSSTSTKADTSKIRGSVLMMQLFLFLFYLLSHFLLFMFCSFTGNVPKQGIQGPRNFYRKWHFNGVYALIITKISIAALLYYYTTWEVMCSLN